MEKLTNSFFKYFAVPYMTTMMHICLLILTFTGNKGAKGHPGEPGDKGRAVLVPGPQGQPGPKGSDGIPGLCDFSAKLHNEYIKNRINVDKIKKNIYI